MHHRRVTTSTSTSRSTSTSSGTAHTSLVQVLPGGVGTTTVPEGAIPSTQPNLCVSDGCCSTPSKHQHQRRRRKKRETDDLTCIIMLVAIVTALLIAGIIILVRVWQSNPPFQYSYSLMQGEWMTAKRYQDSNRGGQQQQQDQMEFPELPASPIYTIPHSMAHIGDRSDDYARLRKTFDSQLPYNPERSLQVQSSLRQYHHLETFHDDLVYDIYNCPDIPPPNYPFEWKTLDVLDHWSPDDMTIPSRIHQGLCVFDYRTDYVKALRYRNAELPFVVTGDPDVAAAVERWNTPTFLEQLLGSEVQHRAEISENSHFMYWLPGDAKKYQNRPKRPGSRAGPPDPILPDGWKAPTKMIRMTYSEFIRRAVLKTSKDAMHWYFRLIGCGETGPTGNCDRGSSEWLFDELTFFQPRPNLLYLKEPSQQRGIHCRFGMQGVTIANHFDSSRNTIVLLGGERRYILSRPQHCPNLALYPKGHPSARHSAMDWSHPDLQNFPEFQQAQSNEIVLQAGDVLYLPTNWFHYIVSLGLNYQCNTRSGTSDEYMPPIRECGF